MGCPVRSWNCIEGFFDGFVEGVGNIGADPCWVAPGYWIHPDDPSAVADPNDPAVRWVDGDYHLKSRGGRWDVRQNTWCLDAVSSPCIDAGDPRGVLGEEPVPNGGRVNMGAYGGSVEASKSFLGEPVCETFLAGDINGDCRVDRTDYELLLANWTGSYSPGFTTITTYEFDGSAKVTIPCSGTGVNNRCPLAISGGFSLAVDADTGTAWFVAMDATLSECVDLGQGLGGEPTSTNKLSDIFRVYELISRGVTDREIVFVFANPLPSRTELTLSFLPGSIRMVGWSSFRYARQLSVYVEMDATADVTGFMFHDE